MSGGEISFEARLHSLAFPQIRAKVPRLVPKMIGFQLVDSNDDETEATGVYAFRVGSQLVYIPIILSKGKIKGLNILHLADDDMMLPMTDDWVDYLINREPFVDGTKDDASTVKDDNEYFFSDVASTFKGASAKKVGDDSRFDLESALFRLPLKCAKSLLSTMQSDDQFARDVLKFYPFEKLAKMIQKRASFPDPVKPGITIDVKVRSETRDKNPSADPINDGGLGVSREPMVIVGEDNYGLGGFDLSDEDRDELNRFGFIVRNDPEDNDASKVCKVTAPSHWSAVDTDGCYNLLTTDGEEIKSHVFMDVVPVGAGKAEGSVVVCEKGGDYYGHYVDSASLTATKEFPYDDYEKMCEALPKIHGVDIKRGDKFVLVNRNQQATPVLKALGPPIKGKKGMTSIWVDQCGSERISYHGDDWDRDYSMYASEPGGRQEDPKLQMANEHTKSPFLNEYVQESIEKGDRKVSDLEHYDYERGRQIVVVDKDNESMIASGEQLMVGSEVKVMKLEPKEPKYELCVDKHNIWPLVKNAGAKTLKVIRHNADEYSVECGMLKSGRAGRVGAARHLICVHGLSKSAAHAVLLDAESHTRACGEKYAIKHAARFPRLDLDIRGSDGSHSGIQDHVQTVQHDEGAGDPFLTEDIANAQEAASTGIKSVFDTSIFASMIRRHDVGGGVDELLGDLTLGLDRINRILFMLYIHPEEFSEHYGSEDVSELEDSLENISKELGEVLLFLKRKGIETESGVNDPDAGLAAQQTV